MEQISNQRESKINNSGESKIIRPEGVISGKRKMSEQVLKEAKQSLKELKFERNPEEENEKENKEKKKEPEKEREIGRKEEKKEKEEKGISENLDDKKIEEKRREERERKENELLLRSLVQARKEIAALESKKKRSKEEEEKLNKAREEYQKIRKSLLERKIKEMEGLKKKDIKLEAVEFILEEQNKFIEEKKKYRGKWCKIVEHLLDNRIFQAYAKIPKKYRWVGMAALGSAVLLGSGAGVAAAGAYFGLKLSKYAVGSLTSAGALKAVQMFEEIYGRRVREKFELKANEFFKKNNFELTLDNLIKEADSNLEKVIKSKKWTNRAKILAGIGGYFAGYELTDIIGHNIVEVCGLDHSIVEKGGHKIKKYSYKEQFIETVQKGDSVWKLAEKALVKKLGSQWNQLDESQKIYFIDAIKDKVSANPEKFGLHTDNIDLIHPGDKIDFSSTLNNEKFLNNVLEKAEKLSPQEKVHIISGIDWKKEVIQGKEMYVSAKTESIGNVRVGFIDINHDYAPDKAVIINQKGELLKEIDFKGDPYNLKDISLYLKEVKERTEEISEKYPPEILNDGEIFEAVENNPKILSQIMEIKNNFGIKDVKEAFSDYQLLTKYHLFEHSELLKGIKSESWDLDQLKILKFISENYSNIEKSQVYSVLDFSKHLEGISVDQKINWIKLYLDPAENIDALTKIKPDIDLNKVNDIYWKNDGLVVRVNRKLWFDKNIIIRPPIENLEKIYKFKKIINYGK